MKWAARLTGAGAAVLLPLIQPAVLGGALTTLVSATAQQPVAAQSAEAVAKIAQAITVRIEGATQGSGVLVKRDGNRYTVLTAWHVVSGQRPGEELAVYTSDGLPHAVGGSSIRQVGNTDMAILSFHSDTIYQTAKLGSGRDVGIGTRLYVAGYPLPTTAVPSRLFRFLDGLSIAVSVEPSPGGYDLLYSNPTLPGMSGGPLLDSAGRVVGVHGRAETDSQMSEQQGVAVKTGTNQGMPIDLFRPNETSKPSKMGLAAVPSPVSIDDESSIRSSTQNDGASQDLMKDLALAAAVNSCELAVESGLRVETSLMSSAKASAYVVNSGYSGFISGLGRRTSEQLAADSLVSAAASVAQGCGAKLSKNDIFYLQNLQKSASSARVVFVPASHSRQFSIASMNLMNDLALAAAVNTCEMAVESKVPAQNSVLSNAKAITYVVSSRYGGQIGNTTKLQPDQIANGTIIQTVARVKQGCYPKLNAADKKFVDDVIADFEKQMKAQGQKK